MKNQKKVYIVLQTSNIGGAEKRFLELWCYFQMEERKNIYLVVNQTLYDIAIKIDSLHLLRTNPNIIVLENRSKRHKEFFLQFLAFIFKAPRGTVFHYPLIGIPFLHSFFNHKMIISMVNSTYYESVMSQKSKILFRINSFFAHKIDILNPKIFYKIKKTAFKKDKVYLTVGSMVKESTTLIKERKNKIVFQGRFEVNDIKNVFKYTRMLPFIHTYLLAHGIKDIEYYILGHGVLKKKLEELLEQVEYENLDIKCYFEHNPLNILKDTKVILSLQKYENYPSRTLIESMSLGVIPIITNAGESNLFENKEIIKYINSDFTEKEISIAILKILELNKDEYNEKSLILKSFIAKNHSISRHAKYYLNLYGLDDEN